MTKLFAAILIAAVSMQLSMNSAEAGRFSKCECVGQYDAPKGVYRIWTCKVKKEWETRERGLSSGRFVPYQVQVITYRARYSNGVSHTWKCVVAGPELTLGK